MSRWIDAEWLKELYKPYENFEGKMYSVPVGAILANIDDAPSIDICFCRECKHDAYIVKCEDVMCMKTGAFMKKNDFCSYGQKERASR